MAKKRKRTKKISKGLRPSISSAVLNYVAAETSFTQDILTKAEAWRNGKNPWMTVPNPNPNETNKRFIKIKSDAFFGGTFKDLRSRFKREREGAVH